MTTARTQSLSSARTNIVLTGFMGTGKTTVGKILAESLDRRFLDTDAIIEERHGPISAIFAELGEAEFRRMEREVAHSIGTEVGCVVATGGRLMLDPEARRHLEANGRVFCLTADVDELVARLSDAAQERPLLTGENPRGAIRTLLENRAAAYAEFEQIPTSNRSPQAIADDVLARLGL